MSFGHKPQKFHIESSRDISHKMAKFKILTAQQGKRENTKVSSSGPSVLVFMAVYLRSSWDIATLPLWLICGMVYSFSLLLFFHPTMKINICVNVSENNFNTRFSRDIIIIVINCHTFIQDIVTRGKFNTARKKKDNPFILLNAYNGVLWHLFCVDKLFSHKRSVWCRSADTGVVSSGRHLRAQHLIRLYCAAPEALCSECTTSSVFALSCKYIQLTSLEKKQNRIDILWESELLPINWSLLA